jgi:hypothetical protein
VIEAAPAQGIGELAGAIGGEHHVWDRTGRDGAELGNTDLKIRKQLQQKRLEFFVRAIDLIDEQHRRPLAPNGGEQRSFEQIFL